MDTRNKEKINVEKTESKRSPQLDFIEGWKGSLPTKPCPTPTSNYKLVGDDPNVECHDHAPRDRCDSSCRFFTSLARLTKKASAPPASNLPTEEKKSPAKIA